MLTLDKVYKARQLLKSVARYTDMIESNGLTDNCQLRLKAENLQLTGSFKLRGAFFKIASLPPDGREIVACSAGNHSHDADTFKHLDTCFVAFVNTYINLQRITGLELRNICTELFLCDLVYEIKFHVITPPVTD